MILNCASFFEKTWKTENKEIYKTIKVNLGEINSKVEIKSKGKIFLRNGKIENEFENTLELDPESILYKSNIDFTINEFEFKGIKYRGDLEIVKDSKTSKILLVNRLPLEEYLKGVVPSEMPASWHLEALKAQAVAARTYAVNAIRQNKEQNYHIESTTQSQVYSGTKKETKESNLAVTQTSGKILLHANTPINAFYHSNSGGVTESSDQVWGTSTPYTMSKKSPYCEKAPNFNWEYKLSKELVKEKLKLTDFTSIQIISTTPSGRIKELEFKKDDESIGKISAVEFRKTIGANFIKSLLFKISIDDSFVVFNGKGFGHGVGMSQWGTKFQADEGKNYKEILEYYYSDIDIANID
jgi:stage II sporulation protein D